MNPYQIEKFANALGIGYKKIDLSTARVKENIVIPEVGADGFHCDYRTTGTAELFMQDPSMPGFPVRKQSGLQVEFNRLWISNDAQAGKLLYLWYGRGFRWLQTLDDITSIGTISLVSAIVPRAVATAWFRRGVNLSALQTIVTPAANTAGIIVHSAGAFINVNGDSMRVMWKTTAPASFGDTTAGTLAYAEGVSSTNTHRIQFSGGQFPTRLPAGVGLYVQQEHATDTAGGAWVDYEVQT